MSWNSCGGRPLAISSCDVLLNPFCEAREEREDSPACACAWVTEMPLESATWSMTANLISQDSTAAGICSVVSWMLLPYGLAAVFRLDTWVSSEDTVIRWSPTIAADPTCTGEQAASTAHAPRPAAPSTPTRRRRLVNRALRDTDDPFHFFFIQATTPEKSTTRTVP